MTMHSHLVPRDSRILMVAFGSLVLGALAVSHLGGLVLILVYLAILHRVMGPESGPTVRNLWNIVSLMLLVVIINAVLVEGEPLPYVPFVSREGLAAGVFFAVRVLVLYLAMMLLMVLVPPEGFARAVAMLVMPFSAYAARRAALYSFLTIGFVPLFGDEFQRILIAQRFRGGGLEGGLARRIRGVRLLFIPLVLSAIHRSAQLAMVVELRGIQDSIGTILVFDRPLVADYVFAGTTGVVVAAAIFFL